MITSSPAGPAYTYGAVVTEVHDGDTITVDIDLGFGLSFTMRRIRLYGINAPELNTEAGKHSASFLKWLLPTGTKVILQTVKDKTEKYGRYLGTIWLDGHNVNARMVEEKLAVPYMV